MGYYGKGSEPEPKTAMEVVKMPWVDRELCIGCGICIDGCPADAISLVDEKADIDQFICIRCGKCHPICPEDAVIHDSKRIPLDVEENVARAKVGIAYYGDEENRQKSVQRWVNWFRHEQKVAEQTIAQLEAMKNA